MKHQTFGEVLSKAQVSLEPPVAAFSRRERLERWAHLLEVHSGKVFPFLGMEHLRRHDFMALRGDETPLSVAFADRTLRADGLGGDSVGDVMDYFGLSRGQVHRLFCDCHYAGTMTPPAVASQLRWIAGGGLIGAIAERLGSFWAHVKR